MFAKFFPNIRDFISTEKFVLAKIFVICLLINIAANQSIFLSAISQKIPIIFLGSFALAGIASLTWGLCRSWTLILLGIILAFQLPQTIMYTLFGARLTPFVFSAIREATRNEIMAYINVTTISLIVLAILLIVGVLIVFKKVFQKFESREKYFHAFNLFFILTLISLIVSFPFEYKKNIQRNSYWFCAQPTQVVKNYFKSTAFSAKTLDLLNTLPSPAKFDSHYPYEERQDGLTVIVHIGESTRADMFSLNGYKRKTTPFLENHKNLINFPSCVSVACSTGLAQIAILTGGEKELCSEQGSVLDLLQKHKFTLSAFNGQLSSLDIRYDSVFKKLTSNTQDRHFAPGLITSILPQIEQTLSKNAKKNSCIIINNEGNHTPFNYFDPKNAHFQPVSLNFENPKLNSQETINAYDNCTVLLDSFIEKLITKTLQGRPFLYIYIGDHGEFLGQNGLWGRGSLGDPKMPYHKTTACLVPFFVIWSPELLEKYPSKAKLLENLAKNQTLTTCHANFFHTLLGLLEISSPCYKANFDLSAPTAKSYEGPQPEKK